MAKKGRKGKRGKKPSEPAPKIIYFDFDDTLIDKANFDSLRYCIPGGLVFPRMSKLFPETKSTLRMLKSKGYEMQIITLTQILSEPRKIEKIESFGITEYFEDIHVVRAKNSDTYRSIVVDPTAAVMVGNSFKHDIEPSAAIGMRAYHLVRSGDYPEYRSDRIKGIKRLNDLLKYL